MDYMKYFTHTFIGKSLVINFPSGFIRSGIHYITLDMAQGESDRKNSKICAIQEICSHETNQSRNIMNLVIQLRRDIYNC